MSISSMLKTLKIISEKRKNHCAFIDIYIDLYMENIKQNIRGGYMKKMKLDPSGKTSFILRLENKVIKQLQAIADEDLTSVQNIIRRFIGQGLKQRGEHE